MLLVLFFEIINKLFTYLFCPSGPALETVRTLVNAGEKFDMMFLDGEKKDYIEFVKVRLCYHAIAVHFTVRHDQ